MTVGSTGMTVGSTGMTVGSTGMTVRSTGTTVRSTSVAALRRRGASCRRPVVRFPIVSPPTDVLIVGAGPVGLTLATLLQRHGTRFRIVDQSAGPVRESRATDVHARTLELFSTIDLAEPLIARGKKAHAANFYSGGRRVAHIPFTTSRRPTRSFSAWLSTRRSSSCSKI